MCLIALGTITTLLHLTLFVNTVIHVLLIKGPCEGRVPNGYRINSKEIKKNRKSEYIYDIFEKKLFDNVQPLKEPFGIERTQSLEAINFK